MNEVILTFDTDWCNGSMIECVLAKLEKYNVKSTWFVTNYCESINKMRQEKMIEVGIHPNFHPDSTQGVGFDDIMNNLKILVPDAVSMRSHTLLWSSRFMNKLGKYGIKYDSSLLLQNAKSLAVDVIKSYNLIRFPIYWEDDIALLEDDLNIKLKGKGLKVLNFHPIHICSKKEVEKSLDKVLEFLSGKETLTIKEYGANFK